MSGILLGYKQAAEMVTDRANELCFTPSTRLEQGTVGRWAWAVSRVDDLVLWGSAHDPATDVTLLLGGRIALEEAQWQAAEALPFTGGLAARWLLHLWLAQGKEMLSQMNGAAVVVILDPREEGTVSIATDRLGIFPLYFSCDGPAIISSHPDVVASLRRALHLQTTLDRTSVAEVLQSGQASQPYTYWEEIHQFEPAWLQNWSLQTGMSTGTGGQWWQSGMDSFQPTPDIILVQALADALKNSVRLRTNPRLGRPVLMLSGGADSRCALFAAQDPSAVLAFTLCDEINPEVETAKALAETAKATHVIVKRDPDAYGVYAKEAMRIAGGTWCLIDAHYGTLQSRLTEANPGVVLTGCYADYMFKGLGLDREERQLFGRNLPLYNLAPFAWSHYQPHSEIAASWTSITQKRWGARIPEAFRGSDDKARLAREDCRLRPLGREPDSGGRVWLWRTQAWDPILSDAAVIRVFTRMSPAQKANGILFGKAVDLVCGEQCRHIYNNNYGTPVGASESQRTRWFIWAVLKRKISRLWKKPKQWGDGIATSGSWPDWNYFFKTSASVAEVWGTKSEGEQALLTEILGEDPWTKTQEQWANHNTYQFARMVSFLIWSRQLQAI